MSDIESYKMSICVLCSLYVQVHKGSFMSRLKEIGNGQCHFVVKGVPVVECVRMDFHVDERNHLVFCKMVYLEQCMKSLKSVKLGDEPRCVPVKCGDWTVETVLESDLRNPPKTPLRRKGKRGAMTKSSKKKLILKKGSGKTVINEVSSR